MISRLPTAYRLLLTKLPILALTLLAFFLRVWQLEQVPPGWRDDELIESLVISQKILAGDLAVFYPDASGHEALYHALKAPLMAIFGSNALGMRFLAAVLGTLAVPLTYVLGQRMFGRRVGLVAAACLATSFWGLMYARVGIRHVAMPVFALATFYWFWRAVERDWEIRRLGNWKRGRGAEEQRSRGARESLSVSQSPSLSIAPHYSLATRHWLAAGLWMGLGFYTYFASRGVPLVLLAFGGYWLLLARPLLRRSWRGMVLMFVLAGLLALPLVITLGRQPESEARVAEVAVPLVEARAGNFEPLLAHVVAAFNMIHSDGDPEWLYNIPGRPVFGPIGAIFFWLGVGVAVVGVILNAEAQRSRGAEGQVAGGRWQVASGQSSKGAEEQGSRGAGEQVRISQSPNLSVSQSLATRHSPLVFLLLWWLGGTAPAFLSVPPASLGHTILAQPAVYLLAALPVGVLWSAASIRYQRWGTILGGVAAVLLVGSVAVRDLPAYFVEWPERGMVRFLYRADIKDAADYLNTADSAPTDFGITGLLAGPWDRVALEIDLDPQSAARPRWYNPERVALLRPPVSFNGYPDVAAPYADWYRPLPEDEALDGGYVLSQLRGEAAPVVDETTAVCFANGLCLLDAKYQDDGTLELLWRVARDLDLPPMPLISNPPPPGVYAGPRLLVFAQLQDSDGGFLVNEDGLWVDPITLRTGDLFVQRHYLVVPEGKTAATVVFGLYDPMTGERVLTVDGRDHLELQIGR